jgi:hypothetical protein
MYRRLQLDEGVLIGLVERAPDVAGLLFSDMSSDVRSSGLSTRFDFPAVGLIDHSYDLGQNFPKKVGIRIYELGSAPVRPSFRLR